MIPLQYNFIREEKLQITKLTHRFSLSKYKMHNNHTKTCKKYTVCVTYINT